MIWIIEPSITKLAAYRRHSQYATVFARLFDAFHTLVARPHSVIMHGPFLAIQLTSCCFACRVLEYTTFDRSINRYSISTTSMHASLSPSPSPASNLRQQNRIASHRINITTLDVNVAHFIISLLRSVPVVATSEPPTRQARER